MGAQPSRPRCTAFGFTAIVLWSTTVAFARSVSEAVGLLTSASLIYLIGGALALGHQALRGGLSGMRSLGARYLLGCGGLFVVYIVSLYLGLGLAVDRSQVLEIGLLNYLWPMLTLIFSVPILKTRASWWLLPGGLLGTAGIFLTLTQNQPFSWASFASNVANHTAPYLLGLTAGVSWALYNNLSRRWGTGDSGAVPAFMLATGALLAIARLFRPEQSTWDLQAAGELLFLAVAPNLAYVLWEQAMRKGDIIFVAAASYFTPYLATSIAIVYLGADAGPKLWAGCALIIAGAVVCKLSVRER